MPLWGDKTHDWDAINNCVEIMYEEIPEYIIQAKEKFGYLRCYVSPVVDAQGWRRFSIDYTKKRWLSWMRWLFHIGMWRSYRQISIHIRFFGFTVNYIARKKLSASRKTRMEQDFPLKYRYAYEKCLRKYPHMKKYILMDADFPKYLKGLVQEKDCDHEAYWKGKINRCGVCMKEWSDEDTGKE